MDRHTLYELCVQSPAHTVHLLRAIHAHAPVILREDFCGTAAVSRRWARDGAARGDGSRAVCTDIDSETLRVAADAAQREGVADRLTLIQADATTVADRSHGSYTSYSTTTHFHLTTPADITFVGNFSIGYILDRAKLLNYFLLSLQRLAPRGVAGRGGVFACDTYGGAHAFKPGGFNRTRAAPDNQLVRYSWLRESADPLTGIVENSISFRVERNGEVTHELPRAFTYRWRLWSIHELRETLYEAGFTQTAVYSALESDDAATPRPVDDQRSLGEDWAVLIAAWA